MNLTDQIRNLAIHDIFKEAKRPDMFVGRPYYLDFEKAYLLITDAWKEKVKGIPQGTFLLAFYENAHDNVDECLLLRAIRPAKLPTDNDVIASMVEYYKDNLKTSGIGNQLDDYTRYTFSFSGLECRILGTFFRDQKQKIQFGADVENYYSAHNYVAYKPTGDILAQIVNFRDGKSIVGAESDFKIGKVRYSSSTRFQENIQDVPVFVSPVDFLGKRTALFGMTRTGKSNTVKKVIEATTEISKKATVTCNANQDILMDSLEQFTSDGVPKYKVGQIIFDMNGEYANANMQDDGTAIFQKYETITTRFSVIEKEGFNVLKINFFSDIVDGFELVRSLLSEEKGDYIRSFLAVDLEKPNINDKYSSEIIRWERKCSVYLCCLASAGFSVPKGYKTKFSGNKEINNKIQEGKTIDPTIGIDIETAITYWTWVAEHQDDPFFTTYTKKNGHPWIDEDLKAILVMLTRKRDLSSRTENISGYRKLVSLRNYHTIQSNVSFEQSIISNLRDGKIVILDLSQGDPVIQQTFSDRICKAVFHNAMDNFVNTRPNNFIQFYFEEAHNLFPKKDDKDLSGIYNRIAKEGAKLNIGLIYATQEVSSISANILKNTQNWFIAHLNNEDELKEIRKFYDFADFCDSLVRYSAGGDKGFIRMKTYSNSFIVPVQIDRFQA